MQPGGDLRRRRRSRTWAVVVAVVLAVLLGLGVVGFLGVRYVAGLVGDASSGFDPGTGEMLGETDVPVERMDLTSTVAATGSLTAGRPVTVGFTGSGEVTAVEVAVGDQVVAGQVLARLDPRLAQLDVDAAEAALAAAEGAAGLASGGDVTASLEARAAEARVAVASARTALASTQEVADANRVTLRSAVDAAARQRDRDAASAAAAEAAADAAEAAQATPAARQAAAAELAAARAAAAEARTALVAAAQRVADAPEGQAKVDAQDQEAAAVVAAEVAAQRVLDAEQVLGETEATVAAAAAARAEAATARAASDASADAVVAAADARRTGLAADAQGIDSARSSLAQSEAALRVLLAGDGPPDAGGPSAGELQVAVGRARLDLETARAALAATTVVAPLAATVTAVDVTVGTAVGEGAAVPAAAGSGGTAAAGTITLTATQALVAEVTVPETDAVLLEDGMPAELKFSAIPDVVGTGQVLTVVAADPADGGEQPFDPFTGMAAPAQKSYTVTVAVDELPAGARAGLSVAARVTTGSAPDALVVPTAAVVQADGATMVRVVDGGSVEEVDVELGLRQGGYTEVLAGLQEGDLVRVGDPVAGMTEEELVDGP